MATEPTTAPRTDWRGRSQVQMMATLVAVTFVIAGVAGFIPGLTTNLYEGLEFIGHDDEQAKLLGLFHVSWVHNFVHLGFGIVGLAMMKSWSGARTYLIGGGAIYLALWLLGLVGGLDWLPANNADDFLHLGLGVGMIGLGVATTRGDRPPA